MTTTLSANTDVVQLVNSQDILLIDFKDGVTIYFDRNDKSKGIIFRITFKNTFNPHHAQLNTKPRKIILNKRHPGDYIIRYSIDIERDKQNADIYRRVDDGQNTHVTMSKDRICLVFRNRESLSTYYDFLVYMGIKSTQILFK